MSDNLSNILQQASNWTPPKEESSGLRLITALERALKATTHDRPGCPWDELEEDHQKETPGYWLPGEE